MRSARLPKRKCAKPDSLSLPRALIPPNRTRSPGRARRHHLRAKIVTALPNKAVRVTPSCRHEGDVTPARNLHTRDEANDAIRMKPSNDRCAIVPTPIADCRLPIWHSQPTCRSFNAAGHNRYCLYRSASSAAKRQMDRDNETMRLRI